MFYLNLAKNNIKNDKKRYIPYFIISIFIIAIFYILGSIGNNPNLTNLNGGDAVKPMLFSGIIITGIFSCIFLFYISSFLMKKRMTEFGLYNVLGLNKNHIIKVMFFEKIIISLSTIIIGIIIGIILDKILFLILLKLINADIVLGFYVSTGGILATIILFLGIAIVTFLYDVILIKKSNTIELLKNKNIGEKEPKVKIILFLIGSLCLGYGYYHAYTIGDPIKAMNAFLGDTIFVIIGTYSLFMWGSIVILKFLKSKPNIYYKTNNFISISTMMYRMKRNAIGLANICILSTAVIVTLATTFSLYIGIEELFEKMYPNDIDIQGYNIQGKDIKKIDEIIKGLNIKEGTLKSAKYQSNPYNIEGDKLKETDNLAVSDLIVNIMPLSEYNKELNNDIKLKKDEALIYCKGCKWDEKNISIKEKTYKVINIDDIGSICSNSDNIMKVMYVVLNDDEITGEMNYSASFDLINNENVVKEGNDLKTELRKINKYINTLDKITAKKGVDGIYGGFLFIGILIGVIFLSATILIIYYKQISEGFDDKECFEIMKKVGLEDKEIKKIIRKQVGVTFLSPVVVATIHLFFAYPAIEKILKVLNLTNTEIFFKVICITVLLFILVYVVVYMLTSKIYYKIIK